MANKKRNRLPKKLAGIKVPKRLRKGRVADLLASPLGQAIAIEAIIQTGERLIGGAGESHSSVRRLAGRSADILDDAGQDAAAQSSAVAYAMRQATRAFIDALREQRRGIGDVHGPEEHEEARLEKKARHDHHPSSKDHPPKTAH